MAEAKYKAALKVLGQMSRKIPVTKEDQVWLYAFTRQAISGDYDPEKVKPPNFPGQEKVDAWQSQQHVDKEGALEGFVERVLNILSRAGTDDAKKWAADIENAK